MSGQRWYTVEEVAEELHVRPLTAWRLVRPYRDRCHLARKGRHPRRVLWIPEAVLRQLREARDWPAAREGNLCQAVSE